ncbi:MCE family protein [bacterium]|nr:MCE family protein [bacterium]
MNRELKIGIFAIAVISIATWLIITISNYKIRKSSYSIIVDFSYIGGLDKGAPVRISGVKVGEVKKVFLFEGHPRIVCSVEKGIKIAKKAKIYINTLGIIGENYVEIMNVDLQEGFFDDKNSKLPFIGRDAVSMGDLIFNLNDFSMKLSKFEKSIGLINGALTNLDKNLNDIFPKLDNMLKPLDRMSSSLESLIVNGNQLITRSNKLLDDIPLRKSVTKLNLSLDLLNDIFKNTKPLVKNIKEGKGSLGKLLTDDNFYKKLNKLTNTAENYINKGNEVKFNWQGDLISQYKFKSFEGSLGIDFFPNKNRFYHFGLSYVNNNSLLDANINILIKRLLLSGGIYRDTPQLGFGYYMKNLNFRIDSYNWNNGIDALNIRFALRYYFKYAGLNLTVDNTIYNPVFKFGLSFSFPEKDFKYLIGILK